MPLIVAVPFISLQKARNLVLKKENTSERF